MGVWMCRYLWSIVDVCGVTFREAERVKGCQCADIVFDICLSKSFMAWRYIPVPFPPPPKNYVSRLFLSRGVDDVILGFTSYFILGSACDTAPLLHRYCYSVNM